MSLVDWLNGCVVGRLFEWLCVVGRLVDVSLLDWLNGCVLLVVVEWLIGW